MSAADLLELDTAEFPEIGAFRVHRAPTQLRPRGSGPPPDRFDDPRDEYRMRYFATSLRGCFLEVLDHFREDADAEAELASVENVEGLNILDEEPPGQVPDQWLSDQRFTIGKLIAGRQFIDVADAGVLAKLNGSPVIQQAFRTHLVSSAFGPHVRLDLGTICAAGPAGRRITQAVSQVIYLLPSRRSGIAYVTRFDHSEQCWAVFDDRAEVDFTVPEPLDLFDEHLRNAVQDVAALYGLTLPAQWRN